MTQTRLPAQATAWARITAATEVDRRIGLAWHFGLGMNRAAPAELLLRLLDLGAEADFLFRDDLPDGVMDAAAVHPTRFVRGATAEIGRLSAAQWERLIAASPEPELKIYAEERRALRRRSRGGRGIELAPHPDAMPPSTPDEIAAMTAEVPDGEPEGPTTALWWIGALHSDAAAMRQLARSPKPLVRRSVARAPRLPAEVVALLAGDEDRVVRLFLAESCDDAPPEMLVEVAGWWDGSLSFPGRPRSHPNFPREGLVRFSADANPLLRALALDDPGSTPALVEQFSHDPDGTVRRSAAQDRRLAPESAVRLADDRDHGVRWRAQINPSLPAEELVGLLLDPRGVEAAVHNPAIPVPVMFRMVELSIPLLGAPPRMGK